MRNAGDSKGLGSKASHSCKNEHVEILGVTKKASKCCILTGSIDSPMIQSIPSSADVLQAPEVVNGHDPDWQPCLPRK